MTTRHAPVGQRQPTPPSSGEVAGSSPARALHPGQCPACPEVLPSLETYTDHRFEFHGALSARAVEEWEAATVQRLKAAAAHAKSRAPETPGAAAPSAGVVTRTFGGQAIRLRTPASPPAEIATAQESAAPAASPPPARKETPMPRPCGYCQTVGHGQKDCPKRKADEKARRDRTAAARRAAPAPPARRPKTETPATTGAVLVARGNGLDLDSLRQAHALCEQRAQQYAESAQNLKAILLLESALAAATSA